MLDTDNLKIVKWMECAKNAVNEDQDLPIVFSDKEFIEYINYKVPLQIKISKSYIDEVLTYNPATSRLSEENYALYGQEFKTWWTHVRKEQELKLYKRMLMNGEVAWQKWDNVLNKRFGRKWVKTEHQTVDQETKVSGSVSINFIPKEK
jgi:hypothetical protein